MAQRACVPKRRYAPLRKSEARTRPRNWSGVTVGGKGSGFGSTAAGAAAFTDFFAVSTCREPRKLLGRQLLRLGVDRFGRRTVKGNALVIAKYGLAIGRRHFPADKHAERVPKRPAHLSSDLAGGADRQR